MKQISSKSSEKRTNEQEKPNQLGMGLKYSKFEFLFKLKRLARQVERNYTVLPFWQNGYIWAAISSIFGVTAIILVLIISRFSELPPEVPLLYDIQEENWESYPRIFMLLIPAALLVLGMINIQILRKTYYMNKRLTLMICLIITISSLLTLVASREIILLATY